MDHTFLDLKFFVDGMKFVAVPESPDMKAKMLALLNTHDYLMFFQNFDLFQKTCDGGILFRGGDGKNFDVILGVVATGKSFDL